MFLGIAQLVRAVDHNRLVTGSSPVRYKSGELMVKFWVSGFTLFLFLLAALRLKRRIEFETLLIHDSPDQKVYLAFEKTGYLKNVSTEAGVNSLLVVKKMVLLW